MIVKLIFDKIFKTMHYTIEEIREIPIFFIVGKGRSGTTLLSTILDSHPEVASATESRFLLILWQRYKNLKKWSPEMAEEFYKNLMLDLQVKKLWNFKDDFKKVLRELPEETQASDLIKIVYLYRESNFPKEKIRFIVDKNPMFTLFVDKIKVIFPEAKFYRLVRDPRDNITSHIRNYKDHCGVLAHKWLGFNQLLDKFEEKHKNDFFTQRYEDLILDKKHFFETFEELSNIKGLDQLEEKRLGFKDQFEQNFDERLKDQHKASVKPLDPNKIGHYKTKLSPEQVKSIENICFPYAEKYSYSKDESIEQVTVENNSRWERKYYRLNLLNRIVYNLPFSIMRILSNYFDNKSKS